MSYKNRLGFATPAHPQNYLYRIWNSMMWRCYKAPKTNKHVFRNYRGRGITVYEPWHDFISFAEDIPRLFGERPTPAHSLDRINGDGNYEPDNLRWATPLQQARNSRRNALIGAYGLDLCISEWAEKLGQPADTFWHRVRRTDESLEDIILAEKGVDFIIALEREASETPIKEDPPEIDDIFDYDDFELERYMHGKAGVSPEFMDANW